MQRTISILFYVLISLCCGALAVAQSEPLTSSLFDPQAAAKTNSREDELYNQGTKALNDSNYQEAVRSFDEAAGLRGRKADAALYWKAYALGKVGNKSAALATIADLRKNYPQSKWLKDAGALEAEYKGTAVDPNAVSDEEDKELAIRSLMTADPEQAVPLLDKVIHGNYSPKLKERALFVLSQSGSEKAQQILLSLAKANNDPELQKRAIRYIGMGGSRNGAILKEIYNGASDRSVKKAVFQAWLMCGCKDEVLKAAQTEKDPGLRREAIRHLGMMGGHTELRQLYQQQGIDLESKEELLKAMGIGGDAEGLAQIAKTEQDPVVRRLAIRDLGIFGGQAASDTLVTVYGAESNLETKKAVINALFLNGAGRQMVFLARKETNPELKRELTQKMSLMSSPEITDYMMEVLNK